MTVITNKNGGNIKHGILTTTEQTTVKVDVPKCPSNGNNPKSKWESSVVSTKEQTSANTLLTDPSMHLLKNSQENNASPNTLIHNESTGVRKHASNLVNNSDANGTDKISCLVSNV